MTELKRHELRSLQLDILAGIREFCESHGIHYFLAYGSFLGAVRHRGYIPWDDDIDIMIPRADFDIFCASFQLASKPHLRAFSPRHTSDWPFPYAKVSDDRTDLREKRLREEVPLGVNVDIFPLDTVGRTRVGGGYQLAAVRSALRVLNVKTSRSTRRGRGWVAWSAVSLTKTLLAPLSTGAMSKAVDFLAARATGPQTGILVGSYAWSCPTGLFAETGTAEFEGVDYPVPAATDAVLCAIYGDTYMTPPPAAQQRTHHDFTASWK